MQGWPQNTKVLKKKRVLSRQCQITFYGVCTDIMLFQKLKHVWKIIYKNTCVWKQFNKRSFCIEMSHLFLFFTNKASTSLWIFCLLRNTNVKHNEHKESFYFVILGRIVYNFEMLSIFKVLPIMNTYRLKNQICLNSLLLNLLIWIEKSYFLQYLSDRQSACVLLSDNLGTRGLLLLQCQKRQTSRIHFQ